MLLSLLAATVAVVMARPSAPENLILISLTIGAAGLAALCFYRMLAPLVAPQRDVERQPLSERMRADLEREKALTLRSIKELEFDRAMGKVSPQDFDEMAGAAARPRARDHEAARRRVARLPRRHREGAGARASGPPGADRQGCGREPEITASRVAACALRHRRTTPTRGSARAAARS